MARKVPHTYVIIAALLLLSAVLTWLLPGGEYVTAEDGTVDFDGVIAEFRRQWRNYERGERGLKERREAELEAMRKTVDALKKRADDADAKAARLEKDQRINAIIAKAGFKYAEGVDGAAINGILHGKLAALDDAGLKDIEEASSPFESALHGALFKAHRESWKGALLDESGRGTGNPLTGTTGGGYDGRNPWKKGDTWNRTRQMELLKSDPALATKLQNEAGYTPPSF